MTKTPMAVTVPNLAEELPLSGTARSRASAWMTRMLAATPLADSSPAARLTALFLAAHSSNNDRDLTTAGAGPRAASSRHGRAAGARAAVHASSYRSLREAGLDGAGDAGRRTALLEGLGSNALGSLVALIAGAAMLLGVFVGLARLLRIHEFSVMVAMIRGRLGR